MILELIQSWLHTTAEVTVAAGVAFGLYQRFVEAQRGRARAEHLVAKVEAVAAAVGEVKEQTNGMSHRLETLAGEAGEGRGMAKAIAQAAEQAEKER